MYRPDLKGCRSGDLSNFSSNREDRYVSFDRHLMSDSALIRGLQNQSDRQRVIDNLTEILNQRENELRRLRETMSRLELTVAQRDQQVAHLLKTHNTFQHLHSLPVPPPPPVAPPTSKQEDTIVSSDLSSSNIDAGKIKEDKPVLLRSHSVMSLSDDEDISKLTPGTESGYPESVGKARSAVSNPDHEQPAPKVKQSLGPTRSLPPPVSPRLTQTLPPPPVGTSFQFSSSISPPPASPAFIVPGSSKSALENLVTKIQHLQQKVKLLENKDGKDSNELLSVDNYKRMTGELKEALDKKEKELAAATSSKAKVHSCGNCAAMQHECKVLKRRFDIQQHLIPLMSGKLEEKELEVESLQVKLTEQQKEKAALEKLEKVDRGSPGPGGKDRPQSTTLRPGAGPLSQVFTQLVEEHRKCAPERENLVSQLAERDGVIHYQEERLAELQQHVKTASEDVAFERKKSLQTARLEKEAKKKASAENREMENLRKDLGTVSSEKLALTLQLEEYRTTNDNLQRQMQAAKRQMMQRASSEPPLDTPPVPLPSLRQSPQPSIQPASSPQFTRTGSPKVQVKLFECPRCHAQIKGQEAFTTHFKYCSRP